MSEEFDLKQERPRGRNFEVASSVDTGQLASSGWSLPDGTTRVTRTFT